MECNMTTGARAPGLSAGGGGRRWAQRAWRVCLWLSLCLCAVGRLAAAEEVVIVRSSGAGPYQQAADLVKERLTKEGSGVETVTLTDLSDNDGAGLRKTMADNKTKLFVAIGTQAATWLHEKAPESVGVVYCMVSDPEAAGLTKGRVTRGVSTTVPTDEQLKMILQALPKARKIGMLYSSTDKASTVGMKELKGLLKTGYELVAVAVEDCDNTNVAVQKLIDAKPDLIWTTPDANVYNAATVRTLLISSLRAKIAVFGFSSGFVRAGALFGMGVEPTQQGEQCGQLAVDFLTALKADKLAEYLKLDRVLAPRYQLAVNKIVDKQLDSPLAEEVASKADVVFK